MFVETASGTYEFPDDPPGFNSAPIAALPPESQAPEATSVGTYVIAADGTAVYITPDMPSWVIEQLLEQHGGLPPDAPVIKVPTIPPVVPPPPPPGRQPSNTPTPTRLPPAGASPPSTQPRTPTLVEAVKGGASQLVDGVSDIAARIKEGVGGALAVAGDVIGGVVSRVMDTTRGVINLLVPTVSELALGMVTKFHDLAGFMVDKAASISDFTGALAGGMHEALADIFGAPFVWLVKGLMYFVRLLASPLAVLAESLKPVGMSMAL